MKSGSALDAPRGQSSHPLQIVLQVGGFLFIFKTMEID